MIAQNTFNILIADSSGKFLHNSKEELQELNLDINRSINNKEFVKLINNKEFNLIFVCLDNDEFPNEKIVTTIRSSKKNIDTPIIITLTSNPDNKLIGSLYKAGINDIMFDYSGDIQFIEKIKSFQQLSGNFDRLNRENKELRKDNIELKSKNETLNQISIQDKKQIQKAYKELSREIAENVSSSMELVERSQLLTKKIEEQTIIKENYEHISENVPSGIVIVNKDGRFLYANTKASEITGYSISELSKFSMKDLLHPDVYHDNKDRLTNRLEGLNPENNHETRLVAKNGKTKIIEVSGSKTKWKGETADIIVFNDITRVKRLSDLLNIQCNISYLSVVPVGLDQSFKQIFEILCEFEWIDGGGIYLMNNKTDGLELVFHSGLSPSFIEKVQFVPRGSARFKLILKKKSTYDKTNQSPIVSKTVIEEGYKEILIIPLIYNDNIIGALNLVSNTASDLSENERLVFETIGTRITQLITLINTQDELQVKNQELQQMLKEMQEKQQLLIQKSKLESLGEMAAGVAHEINQPLGVIFLSLENILFKISGKNMSQEYLDKKLISISGNIKKIKEIIDHIRTFSRDQKSIIIERVDVNNVIRRACSMIDEQYTYHNILIDLDLEEDAGNTHGNSHKLEQVMYNLLSNAKFALEEKELLSIDSSFDKEIHISTYSDDKKIFIDVKDNGNGIETDNIDNIFNPFFTTKPEGVGTGLGLSIVYGIITEMKGVINIESKSGEYTLVRIELPKHKMKT